MSFFIKSTRRNDGKFGGKKRQFDKKKKALPAPKKTRKDVEITSDEDDDFEGVLKKPPAPVESESESDIDETAEQKKLRLAKEYLKDLEQQELDEEEDEEQKQSLIAHRLKRDILEQSGRLFKPLGQSLQTVGEAIVLKNQHRLPITRIAIGKDESCVFSASKDGSLVKWSVDIGVDRGERSVRIKRAHEGSILAMAISSDGKYLATGCDKNVLTIWNPETLEKIRTFSQSQHRSKVTGLAFRYGTHQLFSCSGDKSVKVWSLDEMAYVETLFGHEDCITAIDSCIRDRALSAGGRDGSLRLWKIPEESQLVFQGNGSSVDCCAMFDDDTFVSGHDDGKIYLWKAWKKKPLAFAIVGTQWITSVGVIRSSDVVAAGSSIGEIVLFVALNIGRKEGRCSLQEIKRVSCDGFINSLSFSQSSRLLVAAVSQEHALGRWERLKVGNVVKVFPLHFDAQKDAINKTLGK